MLSQYCYYYPLAKGPLFRGRKAVLQPIQIALERLLQTSSALSIKDFKPDYNLITQIDTAGRTVNGEYHPYDMKNDLDSISFEEYKQYEESFLDNITTAFKDSIQVGTLKLGGRYTREQIEAVFGKPTLWFSWGAYTSPEI